METCAPLTFVSAYPLLQSTPYYTTYFPEQWSLEHIYTLLQTGIHLCLYVSPSSEYDWIWKHWECQFPGFRVMLYRVDYRDTWIHKECMKLAPEDEIALPEHRNQLKDTYEYLVYGHARIELMEDAISENPFNSTHFAWIDYQVCSQFKEKDTFTWLANLGQRTFAPKLLTLPGCWDKYTSQNLQHVCSDIHWRFCGSFLLGDVDSIIALADMYRAHFPVFLKENRILTWDVNFWAWLEATKGWMPQWYRGDHNDTVLHMSADAYTVSLSPYITHRDTYAYPNISNYYPGSASYLYVNGMHLLNTRFVNYWIYPNGYYLFHHSQNVIDTKNVFSILDPNTLVPINYVEMNADYSDTQNQPLIEPVLEKKPFSVGLEDIRLFTNRGKVRFICTNVNFSPIGKSRMMVGDYDLNSQSFKNCMVLHPPKRDSWCEKNWIPLVNRAGEEWFVYKWRPMELGKVVGDELVIERTYQIDMGLFSKVRGSTTFAEWVLDRDYLVGMVHFSEERSPRHYYHMLVLLEKETFKPWKYSNTFCFEKLAIEFSVGMSMVKGEYVFWISQFDRDPMMVKVNAESIPFVFKF